MTIRWLLSFTSQLYIFLVNGLALLIFGYIVLFTLVWGKVDPAILKYQLEKCKASAEREPGSIKYLLPITSVSGPRI